MTPLLPDPGDYPEAELNTHHGQVCSINDIAKTLGMNRRSVALHLRNGLKKMKQYLKEYESA